MAIAMLKLMITVHFVDPVGLRKASLVMMVVLVLVVRR